MMMCLSRLILLHPPLLVFITSLVGACATRELPPSVLNDTLLVKQGVAFLALPQAPTPNPARRPVVGEPLWQAALQAAGAQDWTRCEEATLAVLERRPYDPDALALLALTYMSRQDVAKSAYFNDLLLQQSPGASAGLNLKGLLLQQSAVTLADYQEAASYFAAAYAASPDELAPGLNLGYLYLDLGNAQRAAEVFADLSERCPSCPTAKLGLGIAESRLEDYDDARAHFKDVLATDAGHRWAQYHLALTYVQQNDSSAALDILLPLLAEVKKEDRAKTPGNASDFHLKIASLVNRINR